MATVKKLLTAILIIACVQAIVTAKSCHQFKLIGGRVVQTPDYRVQMSLTPNATLATVTTVLRDVAVPIWSLLVRQIKINGRHEDTKILFNGTHKVCEFVKYAKRIRMFNEIADNVLNKENGNYSMACPLRRGIYVMKSFSIPDGYLKLLYWPNTIYTIDGAVWSGVGAKQPLKKLCTYQINATVARLC